MKRKRNSSDSADLFAASLVQSSGDGGAGNMEDRARVALISSPLVVETEDWLSKRALTLGNMLSSERAAEYVATLRALAQFREEHEPEPLHEDVELKVCGEDADAFAVSAFKSDIRQLKEWGLITERIEKERLRGYRDIGVQSSVIGYVMMRRRLWSGWARDERMILNPAAETRRGIFANLDCR